VEWREEPFFLYVLPEELSEEHFPRASAEIVLLGIERRDKELEWSHSCLLEAHKILFGVVDEERCYYSANIHLSLKGVVSYRK